MWAEIDHHSNLSDMTSMGWRMNLVGQCHSQFLSVINYTLRYQFNVTYLFLLCCCAGRSSLSTSHSSFIRIHQRDRS